MKDMAEYVIACGHARCGKFGQEVARHPDYFVPQVWHERIAPRVTLTTMSTSSGFSPCELMVPSPGSSILLSRHVIVTIES